MTAETGQKKVYSQKIVIGLGLISIVLAAGLIGVFAYSFVGGSAAEINKLKAENTGLQGNLTSLTSQLNSIQSNYIQTRNALESQTAQKEQLQSSYNELANYVSNLTKILQLGASATLLQNQEIQLAAGENKTLYSNVFDYAGFFTIAVESNSSTTFAQVMFTYADLVFDNKIVVGESGTAAFAVLPGTIDIIIGNTEATNSVAATVTAAYIY